MIKRSTQAGFTIIELMIATLVFSVILIVLTAGLIQIGHTYYKGITSSKTQEVARSVADEIGQAIQFAGANVTQPAPGTRICVGDSRAYDFPNLFTATTPGTSLLAGDVTNCASGLTNPVQLLGAGMRLDKFEVTPVGTNLYAVRVRVIYDKDGDLSSQIQDPLHPSDVSAKIHICNTAAGSQFCSAAEINTTVERRIIN